MPRTQDVQPPEHDRRTEVSPDWTFTDSEDGLLTFYYDQISHIIYRLVLADASGSDAAFNPSNKPEA